MLTMLDRTIPPVIQPLTEMNIQQPERRKLSNGIPLHVLCAGSEDVVRMDILVGAGIWHQQKSLQALFTNRMLREGTRTMNSTTISERLDFYGAWIELNSSMNCNFITLYSLGKYFAQTLAVVASMIKEPVFPEEEMKVTVEMNRQQFLVNSAKVEVMARKEFNRAFFGKDHPCGRHAVLEDYDKLKTEDLEEFYRYHYHSGNCTIFLAGRITDEIVDYVERELGTVPWGEVSSRVPLSPIEIPFFEGKRCFVEQPGAVQSSLRIGCPMMDRPHPDYMPMKVLVTILGGYFGSRLMANIREEKGYTYGIYSTIASFPFNGCLLIATETGNEYVEPCIREIRHELKRLQDELVPVHELDMVKNYMIGEICRSYESPFSLSDAWIFTETAGLDSDFYIRMVETIQQVSREELQRLAVEYFRPDNMLEVVAGKKM